MGDVSVVDREDCWAASCSLILAWPFARPAREPSRLPSERPRAAPMFNAFGRERARAFLTAARYASRSAVMPACLAEDASGAEEEPAMNPAIARPMTRTTAPSIHTTLERVITLVRGT